MATFQTLPYALFVGVSKYYAVSISYRDFLNLTKSSIAVKVTAIISAIGFAIYKYWSRIMFVTAPVITDSIEILVNPCAVTKAFIPGVS